MMVDFEEIGEIAVFVSDFDETLIINNQIVNKQTYGSFVSNLYDA